MQELAAAMATAPEDMLARFVALAMEFTSGTSAGLSIFEPDPAPGLFRWRHVHGALAPFENMSTPREDSPCGVTLDRNEVTLCAHPETIYDWIAAARLVVPEVLLVPLHLPEERPLGTLWVVAAHPGQFDLGHAERLAELGRFAGMAVKMIRSEAALRAALDEQEMLAREMSHRLKNLFAMADGMIRGSARQAATVAEMAETLSGRLHALAGAHALVQREAGGHASGEPVDLRDLIGKVVGGHQAAPGPARLELAGPALVCGARAVQALALVLHELATNAAKYGALSGDTGAVRIAWRHEGDMLDLDWRERGGPRITATPDKSGFGSTLVSHTVERQLGGSIRQDWLPEGLRVAIRLPLSRLAPQ